MADRQDPEPMGELCLAEVLFGDQREYPWASQIALETYAQAPELFPRCLSAT